MNKLDFLRRLDRELSVLDKAERREILGFYEERFYNGTIYENKTEEEVIAELERPEIIARNVLDEYGVSHKYVKTKEERYSNVSPGKAILLISFDVLIASSVLPALYSAVIAILGSTLTWFTTIGLMLGERTAVDEYVFAFVTAAFILLFLFGLVVLEAALWFTRTLVKWHLNVFKFKNRDKLIKKLSHWSLDSWFKKHKRAKRLKNMSLVVALVAIGVSGSWIFRHYDWVEAEYSNKDVVNDVITEDFTAELLAGDVWKITTDLENIDIELVQGSSNDVVVKHSYFEDDEFVYNFNYETNIMTLENDTESSIQFFWNPRELFNLINNRNLVRIELPSNIALDDVVLNTSNGTVYIRNIDFDNIDVGTSNARVDVINSNVTGDAILHTSNAKVSVSNSDFDGKLVIISSNNMVELNEVVIGTNLDISTSNGRVEVIDVVSTNNGNLTILSSNNGVKVRTTGFDVYDIRTSNGSVQLGDLNDVTTPASRVYVQTSNNAIDAEDVYALNIEMNTTNGDIDFDNTDTNFHPTRLVLDTSSYNDIDTNVTED